MAISNKSIQQNQEHGAKFASLDPDDLKNMVCDELISMSRTDCELFIETLCNEVERDSFSVSSYLIPMGIAKTAAELTAIEVGHLIRFLKINVPAAMPAIERAIAQFPAFAKYQVLCDECLGAQLSRKRH